MLVIESTIVAERGKEAYYRFLLYYYVAYRYFNLKFIHRGYCAFKSISSGERFAFFLEYAFKERGCSPKDCTGSRYICENKEVFKEILEVNQDIFFESFYRYLL